MYHTFQAGNAISGDNSRDGRLTGSRRITTSNACGSCRRRKIRCDGASPCGQCVWYQQADNCVYNKPTPRVAPSRKLVDQLSASIELHQAVFGRLFPGRDVDKIASLSREDMIATLTGSSPETNTSPGNSDRYATPDSTLRVTPKTEDAESLEALTQAPDQDPAVDEAERHRIKVQGISDDVNGLSLSVDTQSSYVGASSITAALKVIFKVAPNARRLLALNQSETVLPSRSSSPSPNDMNTPDPTYIPSAEVGYVLIESYFSKIHLLMPMVDEQQFWHTWLYGERRDAPWLALLNAVLALGSMAAGNAEDESHIIYFQRAKQHLDIDSLGSGNLLMVQAFGLISGYYLHYANRPNLANNLMGATLRQATVLGLHRRYAEKPNVNDSSDSICTDVRRRTWWSLYVLDTWSNTTTGRPSLNIGLGVTVQPPEVKHFRNPASIKLLPLVNNVLFCKLLARIQDALSANPLLGSEELTKFDNELLKWHSDLPSALLPAYTQKGPHSPRKGSTSSSCPDFLRIHNAISHWRFQNLRMLLYRPYLLATALRRTPSSSFSAEEQVGVDRCRAIASETIKDISSMCEKDLLAGWNAVWFIYQAAMVPLVSLFSVLSIPTAANTSSKSEAAGSCEQSPQASGRSENEIREWQEQIETTLRFFDTMNRYSVAAKKSKDIVARLYEVSKRLSDYNTAHRLPNEGYFPPQEKRIGLTDFANSAYYAQRPDDYKDASQQLSHHANGANSFAPSTDTGVDGQWRSSLNGDAAMNNFWFDDMMWDIPPTGFDIPQTSGTAVGPTELDWYTTYDAQGPDFQVWDNYNPNSGQY